MERSATYILDDANRRPSCWDYSTRKGECQAPVFIARNSKCDSPEIHEILTLDLRDFNSYDVQLKNMPSLDGVVHCAGIHPKLMLLKFMKLDYLKDLQDVNVNSIIMILSKLWRANKLKANGSIVLMSSIISQSGVMGTLAYGITKGGINSSTKILASEFASKKIRVNSIAAGMVKTPMQESFTSAIGEDFAAKDEARYPFGYGEANDISSFILFLLSDQSKWLTGSVYTADGGYSIK